jgi:hypothetical protein
MEEPECLVLPSTLHGQMHIDVNPDWRAEPPVGVSPQFWPKRYL